MKKRFHFLTQRVLPLVYDDSLSYYEILCKMQNELIELGRILDEDLIDFIREVIPELVADATYDDETGTLEFSFVEDPSEETISNDPIKRISVNGISRPVMDELARLWFGESWLYNKNICMYGDSTLVVPENYAAKIESSGICNSVTVRAVSGQDLTNNGWPAIRDATDLDQYDYVFVCYGINDWSFVPKYQWAAAVRQTAQRILNAGSQPVFVFPWKVYINTFQSAGFINDRGCDMPSFVDAAIDECEQLNIKYINLCQLSGVNESNYATWLTRSNNGYYLHESDKLGDFAARAVLNGNFNTGKCYGERFHEEFKLLLPTNWGYLSYDDTKTLIGSSPLPFRRGKATTITHVRLCEFYPVGCGDYARVTGYCKMPNDTDYVDFSFIDLYNQQAGTQSICRVRSGSDFSFVIHPSYQGNAWKLCAQASSGANGLIMDLSISGSNGMPRLSSDTPSEPCIKATFTEDITVTKGGYIDSSGEGSIKMLPWACVLNTNVPANTTLTVGQIPFYPEHPVYGAALNGEKLFVYRITTTGEIQLYAPPVNLAATTYIFFSEVDLTPTQFLYS